MTVKANKDSGEGVKRVPCPHEDQEGEIGIRQFFELHGFAPSEAVDRARELGKELGNRQGAVLQRLANAGPVHRENDPPTLP